MWEPDNFSIFGSAVFIFSHYLENELFLTCNNLDSFLPILKVCFCQVMFTGSVPWRLRLYKTRDKSFARGQRKFTVLKTQKRFILCKLFWLKVHCEDIIIWIYQFYWIKLLIVELKWKLKSFNNVSCTNTFVCFVILKIRWSKV